MKAEKIASLWMVFVGLSITLLWIILFSTNSVNESHISFILHLAAEAITAFCGLYVGLSCLVRTKTMRASIFLTLGLILASAAGAGGYYLAEMGDIMFFVILESIALVTLLLFVLLYFDESTHLAEISIAGNQMNVKSSKLVNFALGLGIYVSLNSATYFGEFGNWMMVAIHLLTTFLLLYIHILTIRGKKSLTTHDSYQRRTS